MIKIFKEKCSQVFINYRLSELRTCKPYLPNHIDENIEDFSCIGVLHGCICEITHKQFKNVYRPRLRRINFVTEETIQKQNDQALADPNAYHLTGVERDENDILKMGRVPGNSVLYSTMNFIREQLRVNCYAQQKQDIHLSTSRHWDVFLDTLGRLKQTFHPEVQYSYQDVLSDSCSE